MGLPVLSSVCCHSSIEVQHNGSTTVTWCEVLRLFTGSCCCQTGTTSSTDAANGHLEMTLVMTQLPSDQSDQTTRL